MPAEDPPGDVEVRASVRVGEYLEGQIHACPHRWVLLAAAIVLALPVGVWAGRAAVTGRLAPDRLVPGVIGVLTTPGMLVLMTVVAVGFLVVLPSVRAWRFVNSPMNRSGIHWTFSSERIRSRSEEHEWGMPWDRVERLVETGRVLALVDGRCNAFVLPKRAFDRDEALEELRSLARSRGVLRD